MKVYQEEVGISTTKRTQVIEITEDIEKIVEKSNVKNGICQIFLTHATAGLILQEAESGLIRDMEKGIKKLFPEGAGYEHDKIDNNADSHLASGFIGQSRTIPIKDNQMVRGTWQNILVVKFDGPRNHRRVFVTVIGD